MPEFYVKRVVLEQFPNGGLDPEIADSVDFQVNQVWCMLILVHANI